MSSGAVRRQDLAMPEEELDGFLERGRVVHVGTVGVDGGPYVMPTLYVYADRELLLHTTSAPGYFRRNVEAGTRVSFDVMEEGAIYPYGRFACYTSISYASVVGFGAIRIEPAPAEKALLFDRFMAKYADANWQRPQGFYPRLGELTVYRIAVERLTGKRRALPSADEQWPARDNSKTPDAVAPR